LEGWNNPENECCGSWTPDGKYYVFQAERNGVTHIWAMRDGQSWFGQKADEPIQLTSGPMNMIRPTISPDGHRLFAVGIHPRSYVRRFDRASGTFVADVIPGRSAEWVSFSSDRQWVSYTTFPDATLWRSKPDGSQAMQLTYPPMRVGGSRWSPDGSTLAFIGLTPEARIKMYLVDADGASAPRPLTKEKADGAGSWLPDGKSIAFGTPEGIRVVDVATGDERRIETPEYLISVTWSPDGRYIAALSTTDPGRIMLLDFTKGQWEELQRVPNAWYFKWSDDADQLYVTTQNTVSVFRVRISDRSRELVASAEREKWVFSTFGPWVGVTPDGEPMYLHEDGVQRIYALDWNL
jgi:Tol biopolymer transport system component